MRYRSQQEKNFADYLTENKIIYNYEYHRIPYVISKHYTPDFYFQKYNFFIEYKGYFNPVDRKKHLLIQRQHPNTDIRFVFQNASNKLNKKSNTTYGQWCDIHNFLWAENEIPKQWLRKRKQ
mgnify:CR=1 FL=1